jgi:hypothetical protein
MTRFSSRVFPVVVALLASGAITANAQTCRGMPRGGGIAFTLGNVYLGSTYGVSASKGIIALGFNSLSSETDVTAWDGNVRFTVPLRVSKLQACPSLGLEYENQTVPLLDGRELSAQHASAAAGVGLSYEQELSRGISIAPFLAIDYRFNAIVYSIDVEDEEDELSGDTLSYVNLTYGGLVQYKSFYAALAVDRSTGDEGGLYRSRLYLGFSFGGNRSSRSTATPRSPTRSR